MAGITILLALKFLNIQMKGKNVHRIKNKYKQINK